VVSDDGELLVTAELEAADDESGAMTVSLSEITKRS
jgi:hypothetical protein